MVKVKLVTLLFCALFSVISSDETHLEALPSYVDVCYRDDPELPTCLKNSIESLVPMFKDGSTDFELEPLEPMTFRHLVFKYHSPLLGGSISIPNATVSGLSAMTVSDVRPDLSDPKKLVLDFDASTPLVNLKAEYKMVGNVVTTSTKMKGRVDMDLEDVTLTYHVEGDVEEQEGREYITLKNFTWRLKGEGVRRLRLLNDDVVHGRPALNGIVRTVMRSSWRLLKNSMVPTLLPETDKLLTRMFLNFFGKYPYDVLLPKLPAKIDVTEPVTEMDQ